MESSIFGAVAPMRAFYPPRLCVWICSILLSASFAHAHATLVFSHPEAGAVLNRPPAALRLRFNEPVTPLVVRLVDPSGGVRDDVRVSAQNDAIDIVPPELATGTHTLSYRVISADGHPVGGTLTFSIGKPSGSAVASAPDRLRMTAIWLARSVVSVALLCGVGAVFFLIRAGPVQPAVRKRLYWPLAVSILASGASIGLQGLDMLDEPARGLFETTSWRAGVGSPYGGSMMIAIGSAALSMIALARSPGPLAGILSLTALAGVGLCAAASGHASAAKPEVLMRPAVFAHVASVALLLGPMLALAGFGAARGDELRAALRRFVGPTLVCVVGLTASGVLLAVVQVESISGLFATNYGWILLAKLALVGGILATFTVNRVVIAPAGRRGSPRARFWSARAAPFELALLIGVLLLTAGWRLTPPPRALAQSTRTLHIHTDKLMAMVDFAPGRSGANRVRVELLTGDFGPIEAKEARLALTPGNGAIEVLTRALRRAGDGSWIIDDFNVPFAGKWLVSVEALITDFDAVTISENIEFDR